MKYLALIFSLFLLTSCIHPEKAPSSYMKIIHQRLTPAFNNDIVFFADLSLYSGKNRFFVIRVKDSMVINKGICCSGKTGKRGEALYSNSIGSNCSSKGAYKIGASYNGKFGKAFKLYGLDATNSNAYARNVVLHAYWALPRTTLGLPLLNSQGCPTVNPEFLKELSAIISQSNKPVMLYVQ